MHSSMLLEVHRAGIYLEQGKSPLMVATPLAGVIEQKRWVFDSRMFCIVLCFVLFFTDLAKSQVIACTAEL